MEIFVNNENLLVILLVIAIVLVVFSIIINGRKKISRNEAIRRIKKFTKISDNKEQNSEDISRFKKRVIEIFLKKMRIEKIDRSGSIDIKKIFNVFKNTDKNIRDTLISNQIPEDDFRLLTGVASLDKMMTKNEIIEKILVKQNMHF